MGSTLPPEWSKSPCFKLKERQMLVSQVWIPARDSNINLSEVEILCRYSNSTALKMQCRYVTRHPAWIATKYFYFWAINIIIPSGDSNLGPKPLSLLEFEKWRLRSLGHHGQLMLLLISIQIFEGFFSKNYTYFAIFNLNVIFNVSEQNVDLLKLFTLWIQPNSRSSLYSL